MIIGDSTNSDEGDKGDNDESRRHCFPDGSLHLLRRLPSYFDSSDRDIPCRSANRFMIITLISGATLGFLEPDSLQLASSKLISSLLSPVALLPYRDKEGDHTHFFRQHKY